MDADDFLEVLQYGAMNGGDYTIDVLDHDYTTVDYPHSWPVTLSSGVVSDPTDPFSGPRGVRAAIGQVVPGGYDEIVLCYEKITVLDRSGVPAATEIDLGGYCGGIELIDLTGDNVPELVTLVHRLRLNVPATVRRGSFVEVYQLNGTPTRWADANSNWPINVDGASHDRRQFDLSLGDDWNDWNGQVTIRDVDGDGDFEAIHVRLLNYEVSTGGVDTLVEVLDIP